MLLATAWIFHFGYPLYYAGNLSSIKKEQQSAAANHKGTTIAMVLNASFFNKYYNANEKEIEVDGKMYEVISFVENSGVITIVLLPDDKETKLNSLVTNSTDKENKNSKPTLSWCPVTQALSKITATFFNKNDKIIFNENEQKNILFGYQTRLIRPPRAARFA